jgi:hypothetical protein
VKQYLHTQKYSGHLLLLVALLLANSAAASIGSFTQHICMELLHSATPVKAKGGATVSLAPAWCGTVKREEVFF